MNYAPRELTDQEVDKFALRYYGGERIPHLHQDDLVVFVSNFNEYPKEPVYRFYSRGTNDLLVLKYDFDTNNWEQVPFDDRFYSLMWKLLISGVKR